ncbi:hypothetical protein [Bifidobacterium castoris]|uniref:Uncharacterized protein n=1 Tax=Bifidobacterium castoris TaxID=2306972 RepID=A0A430FAM3_9BIFI|nr:hypothetical protein [Bifidobacterium castoris]RSX49875.1 hypothetical protein D2E22_0336 [Bifidobacterium castoris]
MMVHGEMVSGDGMEDPGRMDGPVPEYCADMDGDDVIVVMRGRIRDGVRELHDVAVMDLDRLEQEDGGGRAVAVWMGEGMLESVVTHPHGWLAAGPILQAVVDSVFQYVTDMALEVAGGDVVAGADRMLRGLDGAGDASVPGHGQHES